MPSSAHSDVRHSDYSTIYQQRRRQTGSGACFPTPSTSRYFAFNSTFIVAENKRTSFSSNSHKRDSVANHSSILNSPIQFVASKRAFEADTSELKRKYLCISRNCSRPVSNNGDTNNGVHATPIIGDSNGVNGSNGTTSIHHVDATASCTTANGAAIPAPAFEIFPSSGIRLQWDAALRCSTGVGLNNLGNTCFLNSVLQVLTNTAPLVNYLLSDDHQGRTCACATGFCALCLMKNHVHRIFNCARSGQDTMSPTGVVHSLRCFMKAHTTGRQEDAHELLRYFIDSMQTAALHEYKNQKLDLFTKETSVISRIFGGYHKNEIVCNSCHSSSVTFDPFLDLSIEIKQSSSLESALTHFTCAETLASDNAYLCPKCKRRVSARKMFTIIQPPNVLTIQLKRFDHFGKIDRVITYPERLNLRPYMSEKQGPPINYRLYGIVVHVGRTTHSGHYFAFVKNPCDQWHLMDDSRVSAAPAANALRHSSAYLLFYIRQPTPVASVRPQAKPQTSFIPPATPSSVQISVPAANPDQVQSCHPGFKPAFSNFVSTPAATRSVTNGTPPSPAVINPLKRPYPSLDEKRRTQLPGVLVHPVKFRLNFPKKVEEVKPNIPQSTNGHKKTPASDLGRKCTGKFPTSRPIQDSCVSSSTRLVPYETDDEDDDGESNGMTK